MFNYEDNALELVEVSAAIMLLGAGMVGATVLLVFEKLGWLCEGVEEVDEKEGRGKEFRWVMTRDVGVQCSLVGEVVGL